MIIIDCEISILSRVGATNCSHYPGVVIYRISNELIVLQSSSKFSRNTLKFYASFQVPLYAVRPTL